MNPEKERMWKPSWPNVKHCPNIQLGVVRKTTNARRTVGLWAGILIRDLSDMIRERQQPSVMFYHK
jgi:hypothetical protein